MAAQAQQAQMIALERKEIDAASDDGFQYEEVDVDALVGAADAAGVMSGVDDLDDIDRMLVEVARDGSASPVPHEVVSSAAGGRGFAAVTDAAAASATSEPSAGVETRATVIDDFVRNFFIRAGLLKSLEAFNREWFELRARGKLRPEDAEPVPDVYVRNQGLEDVVTRLRVELQHAEEVASKARATWDQFRKERDYHRMHHKRVVQEKTKLLIDLKRLKRHYEAYEPTIEELKAKYESAMKEKMLMRLERDRAISKMRSLEQQLRVLQQAADEGTEAATAAAAAPASASSASGSRGAARKSQDATSQGRATSKARSRGGGGGVGGAVMPTEDAVNPFLSQAVEAPPLASFAHGPTVEGHEDTVSALAAHPSKPVVASASDDGTWRMWSVPSGELIMTGAGHGEWVADVAFHPHGSHLASSAGDGRIMVWDFASKRRAAVLTEHTQVAWGVDFHYTGDFVASGSMDQTAKVWDITTGRCRQTLRGHVDSVNAVCFQPFSSNLVTASGDKTLSLWDARSGHQIHMFVGHENALNDAAFSLRGDTIASCDADGVVKLWDLRMVAERASYQLSEAAVNKVSWDRSSTVVAAACDDKMVHLVHVVEAKVLGAMRGHDDHVQACVFDATGRFLISAGSDHTVRIWGREADLAGRQRTAGDGDDDGDDDDGDAL